MIPSDPMGQAMVHGTRASETRYLFSVGNAHCPWPGILRIQTCASEAPLCGPPGGAPPEAPLLSASPRLPPDLLVPWSWNARRRSPLALPCRRRPRWAEHGGRRKGWIDSGPRTRTPVLEVCQEAVQFLRMGSWTTNRGEVPQPQNTWNFGLPRVGEASLVRSTPRRPESRRSGGRACCKKPTQTTVFGKEHKNQTRPVWDCHRTADQARGGAWGADLWGDISSSPMECA